MCRPIGRKETGLSTQEDLPPTARTPLLHDLSQLKERIKCIAPAIFIFVGLAATISSLVVLSKTDPSADQREDGGTHLSKEEIGLWVCGFLGGLVTTVVSTYFCLRRCLNRN